MASINYFFKSVSGKFSFDDYVYGLNENKVEWAPTTGSITAVGVKLFDNYIFSPKHYGYFSDTFYSPPDKYYFTNEIKAGSAPANSPPSPPAIVVATLTTGSYRLTSNTDNYLRIMARYVDGETSYTTDETYYETL